MATVLSLLHRAPMPNPQPDCFAFSLLYHSLLYEACPLEKTLKTYSHHLLEKRSLFSVKQRERAMREEVVLGVG